jgi:hypothetical protein
MSAYQARWPRATIDEQSVIIEFRTNAETL